MSRCDWCKAESEKLYSISQLGNTYNICGKCKTASDNGVCIKCGNPVGVEGAATEGKCQSCAISEYEEEQRKQEELDAGVAQELLDLYSSGVEFTEKDYEEWLTFGQGTFSPAYMRECRINWLRKKLVDQGGWSSELVESHMDAILTLMERHISKVIRRKYMIVYVDPNKRTHRHLNIIDNIDNIFIIDRNN